MPKLSSHQRRALVLLAGTAEGLTDAMLVAQGVSQETLADLIVDGLASVTDERLMAGGKMVEVLRLRITDAGRAAL